ncbi:MAG: M16 family metallopeptidase [Tepidiformaceae bacterium]
MSDATSTARDILPFRAAEATLPNGLSVIVVPTGFPNLVSLQIPVQTGSRNEVEPGKSGFAHFFEHMMFRGTARYPASAYQDVVTRSGARQNAYTTDDYTNYHITFAKEDLESILELEADRFMNLAYSEDDFRTEARAVLGEYNKNSADPLNKLMEVQRDHAYTTHTYRHTTMGFIRDIQDMPNQCEYSRTFFDRWYRPEYTTIIVAGDVDGPATLALVEKHWGHWQAGSYDVAVPQEPAPAAPVTAHVPWETETLPWLSLAFHGPEFSVVRPDFAALDVLFDLSFRETSSLYRRLVEEEQIVDQFFPYVPATLDPGLPAIFARVKRLEDMPAVRDAILAAVAELRAAPLPAARLAEAISHARYAFARTLDNSDSVASTLARFVHFERSYGTLNELFRLYDSLTAADLHNAARAYLAQERMVITTLSSGTLPFALAETPTIPSPAAASQPPLDLLTLPSESPLLRFKLLFRVGSAHDPQGKEGLAQLAASMITEAGSEQRRIDEITRALFPMAGSFVAQVDREMTTFTAVIHRDNLDRFADIVLPQLTRPGYREEDFARLKAQQRNALVQDLRANNEEELGRERLQANVFADSGYGHPPQGTDSGIDSLSVEDVRAFVTANYTLANLLAGAAGDVPTAFSERLRTELATLQGGAAAPAPAITPRRPQGIEVEIIAKDTRATAISFGHPIAVTRPHPDFAALWLVRSWLGEHRASQGRLFQRIREVRGMNYGNYAYIEAFPRGMFLSVPDPNLGRRAQLFEIWIRPVPPEQAHMALRIAIHELDSLIRDGLSQADFAATRDYLMKNVFIMTRTQDQQLGYALDSRWYGIGEYTAFIRERLAALSLEEVNAAIRRHLSANDLSVVIITKDAEALRDQLVADEPSPIVYDGARPEELLAEDRIIGARRLNIAPTAIRITPVEDVFAR